MDARELAQRARSLENLAYRLGLEEGNSSSTNTSCATTSNSILETKTNATLVSATLVVIKRDLLMCCHVRNEPLRQRNTN